MKQIIDFFKIKKENKIYFFSEGSNHWAHLKSIVKLLCKKKEVIYISLSSKDEAKKFKDKNFYFFKISNIFLLNFFFKIIKNSLIISSIPDLGKLYFQKNEFNNTYIYIFHSLASCHVQYNTNAFKNFDIIFCSGPHQYRELLKAKEIYHYKYKYLVKYGYPRIEELRKFKIKQKFNDTVLIAPSWGKESITNTCAYQLIKQICLYSNYKVIFRPHNMSFKRDMKYINKIHNDFQKYKNFLFDTSNSSYESLINSFVLIADWGSTSSEYAMGLGKEVISINTKMKILNKEYLKINKSIFEKDIRNELGEVISINNTKNIINVINKLKNKKIHFTDRKLKKYIYNLYYSDKIAVYEIEKLFRQK